MTPSPCFPSNSALFVFRVFSGDKEGLFFCRFVNILERRKSVTRRASVQTKSTLVNTVPCVTAKLPAAKLRVRQGAVVHPPRPP